jgi:hypothetical protein
MGAPNRKRDKHEGEADERTTALVTAALHEAAQPLIRMFDGRIPGSHLSDEEETAVIKLLAMTRGHISEVSRMTGLAKSEVFRIKHANMGAFTEQREQFKKAAAMEASEIFIEAAAVVREKIGEASARDAAVVAGIMAEKSALFAGDNVVTHKHVHSVDTQALNALQERMSSILNSPKRDDAIDVEFTLKDEEEG